MRKARTFLVVLSLVALLLPIPSRAATSEQVEQAIKKATDWLYAQQKNGNWETFDTPIQADQHGGMTAFVVYTLLAAGESPQDERLKPAIDWMLKNDSDGTYAISLRCQVWNLLPPSDAVKAALRKDTQKLLFTMTKERTEGVRGFYSYQYNNQSNADPSCSQYGALGMWAATQAGMEIADAYWEQVDKQWRKLQQSSGGWSYQDEKGDDGTTRASMTCAGVATLYIAQDQLNAGKAVLCKGNLNDPAIDKAMKWLNDHFDIAIHKSGYGLYAIERVGLASGRKFIGTHDWYGQGAELILKSQAKDGSFPNQMPWLAETCFNVLFLVRGRAPLVMSKLEYSLANPGKPEVANWNQRPRDAANLTQWLSKQSERHLAWQITNLDAPVNELLDAPILYITGNQALKFTDDQVAKLKAFAEAGGLILGNADCGNAAFAMSYKALGTKMFGYEFRDLPANHVLYTDQNFPRAKWRTKPVVLGLSNGARELMLLLPSLDASKAWYMQSAKSQDAAFYLAADLFQYATEGKNNHLRPAPYSIARDDAVKATTTVHVARLEYAGNWDPEPGGWRRLAAFMHNQMATDLEVTPVKLGGGQLNQTFKVAHLTGTIDFTLPEAARAEIRDFVNGGGTLIVDAAGGNTAFAAAASKELDAIFGKDAAQLHSVLPADHALYRDDKTPIAYRSFARKLLGQTNTPQLRGMQVKGRVAVFFSQEDLSVGLVGQAVDGITGYTPASATDLMGRMIQYAQTPPEPAKAP